MSVTPYNVVHDGVVNKYDFPVIAINSSNAFVGKFKVNYSLVDKELNPEDILVFDVVKISIDGSEGGKISYIEKNVQLKPGQSYFSSSTVLGTSPYEFDSSGKLVFTDYETMDKTTDPTFGDMEYGIGIRVTSALNTNQAVCISTSGFLSLSPNSHHLLVSNYE